LAENVITALQADAPPLETNHFRPKKYEGVVNPDGTLVSPPEQLLVEPAATSFKTVRASWAKTVDLIKNNRQITPADIQRPQQAVAQWKKATVQALDAMRPAWRLESARYITRIENLVAALDETRRSRVLFSYVREEGFSFPGGTTGDLLRHVMEYGLQFQIGGKGQLKLLRLMQELETESDAEIALLEDRIEYFKTQSPWRGAAIKQRLLAEGGAADSAAADSGQPRPVSALPHRKPRPSASQQLPSSPPPPPKPLVSQQQLAQQPAPPPSSAPQSKLTLPSNPPVKGQGD
jgi:hypothetical protein